MEIKLTVDGKPVSVKPGATILDAANAVGSRIPTLCHDNKLHPFGACRICLVEVQGTPRKFTPACTTPVSDGMVVTTMSSSILEIRKTVLELLLVNHPLDCPVCDKAGECQLQDLVHEYGLEKNRFDVDKRYIPPDYESPIVERNISRCILCGKCVRICDEQNAVGELAFTRRGTKARISTDFDRPLDCEFCGECVEICPVGALTTRQFKYKARIWNIEKSRSICNYCGCGCAITYETHNGKTVRVSPAFDNYLCAKGRFGWDAMRHPDRLLTPKMRVSGKLVDCTWDEALAVVATNLKVIRNKRGAGSIGGLGSVRTTNEDNYIFQKFMRTVVGTNNVDMLGRLKIPRGLNAAFFSGELSKIGEHDVILILDRDVGEINAYTGIEIVRAVNRRSRKLILVGYGFNKFNALASLVLPGTRESVLDALIEAFSGGGDAGAAKAVEMLKSAAGVAIVVPAEISEKEYVAIRRLASFLGQVTFYPVVRRSNIQGGLDMGVMPGYYPGYQKITSETTSRFAARWNASLPEQPGLDAVQMINGIKTGAVSGLYIMGDDPVGSDPGLGEILRKLEFLVVQDIFLTETAKIADVVLPAVSSMEKEGTFTNLERRLQALMPAELPAGEARPDWRILCDLARKMDGGMDYGSVRDIQAEIRSILPMYRDLAIDSVWSGELSPIWGQDVDLSIPPALLMMQEVITSGRLLFSSGMMITRSAEIGTIKPVRTETGGGTACKA